MPAIEIVPIPAFADNYLWLIHNSQNAIIVDPGDSGPVLDYLKQNSLKLSGILITHHHNDHIGGVAALTRLAGPDVPVFGPAADLNSGRIAVLNQGCQQGQLIHLDAPRLDFEVLEVPGHTSTHIAYYCRELAALFCGDTLFAGGCGRLFEGTPAQMLQSMNKICALPADTRIYCAHEYTLSNLRFALTADPDNPALQRRYQEVVAAREQNQPTVPSLLSVELQTNPFLRCSAPEIVTSLVQHGRLVATAGEPVEPVNVFAALRGWKDIF